MCQQHSPSEALLTFCCVRCVLYEMCARLLQLPCPALCCAVPCRAVLCCAVQGDEEAVLSEVSQMVRCSDFTPSMLHVGCIDLRATASLRWHLLVLC
jgi:hypothetical protein